MRTVGATSLVAALAAVAGLAGSAQAQLDPSLITGLSSGCASGLIGIVTNSNISSCLSLTSAVGALTSAGNNSVVPGLNQYLSGSICGSGKTACTKDQLSAANSTLLQACGSDIQGSNGGIPALVAYFINSYDRLRNAGCLQDSQGEYCLVKEMYTLQNVTQMPISFSGIQNILSNQSTQQQSLMALSANKTAFCSDCTHALYSTLFPTNSNAQLASAVNQTCNSTFLDGKIPSTIKSTANGNSTSASSSSSGSGSGKNAATTVNLGSVAAVGSALAALAAGLALL